MTRHHSLSRLVLSVLLLIGVALVVTSIQESAHYDVAFEGAAVSTDLRLIESQAERPTAAKTANRALSTFVPPTELQCTEDSGVDYEKLKSRAVVEKAVRLPAAIAGFHNKSGILSPVQWRPEFKKRRNEQVSVWFSFPRKERSGCVSSQPPLQFPGCVVIINHHYKFIWIKGKRVGGTAIREPLGWVCEDRWKVPSHADMTYCSEYLQDNMELSLDQAQEYWNDYFVFAFVRNPYSRFASSYTYVDSVMGECPRLVNFGKLCDSPFLLAKMCSILACCWSGAVTHHIHHAIEQSSCLFTQDGQVAVDFVGEMESLSDDLQVVLDEINRRKDPHLPDLKISGNYLPKINSQGDHYVVDLFMGNTTCLQRIEQNYWLDFERLGYDRITDSV